MQVNKLKFTREELEVLQNSEFFFVKHRATNGILNLFADLCHSLESTELRNPLGIEGLNEKRGKIFRGENYRLLPYTMLDYPRLFSKESVFSFRSMFWWGNGFSFTIHLQGKAWEIYKTDILKNIVFLKGKGFFICVHKDSPWEYHYGNDNYQPLDEWLSMNDPANLKEKPFLKISRRLDLSRYSEVTEFGTETWLHLKRLIT